MIGPLWWMYALGLVCGSGCERWRHLGPAAALTGALAQVVGYAVFYAVVILVRFIA